jgi:hypothetical protein
MLEGCRARGGGAIGQEILVKVGLAASGHSRSPFESSRLLARAYRLYLEGTFKLAGELQPMYTSSSVGPRTSDWE